MLEVLNNNCGHTFTTKTGNILNRDVNCPVCNTVRKRDRMVKQNKLKYENSLIGKDGVELYKSEVRRMTNINYMNNQVKINPKNKRRGLSGTDNAYHLDHIISIQYCFKNNIPVEICSHPDNLRIIPWKENAKKWKRAIASFPKIFWKYVNNYSEKLKFVECLLTTFECLNAHSEFDAYSPTSGIGIMCHRFDDITQDAIGSINFLKDITTTNHANGVRVIHIYEDEWLGNNEIVMIKLAHILQSSTIRDKVFARKCDIRVITDRSGSKFLKKHHIQGSDKPNISIGAYIGEELLAVMTFCKPRIFMRPHKNQKKDNVWELSRFATSSDYIVVGIASRLLKYFQRNNTWAEIYSFADLRWSSIDTNVYKTLGFNEPSVPTTGYYYIIDGVRNHRWKYRKDNIKKLFPDKYDSSLTEYQNMLNLGYDRVWNCGILKYTMLNE